MSWEQLILRVQYIFLLHDIALEYMHEKNRYMYTQMMSKKYRQERLIHDYAEKLLYILEYEYIDEESGQYKLI